MTRTVLALVTVNSKNKIVNRVIQTYRQIVNQTTD